MPRLKKSELAISGNGNDDALGPDAAQLKTALRAVMKVSSFISPEQRKALYNLAKAAKKSYKAFRILDLPPELRNRIYEYLVIKDKPLIPSICTHEDRATVEQAPLTRVCRQIREETLSLFYSANDFEIHIYRGDFAYLTTWLSHIGERNRKLLHKVRVNLKNALTCGDGLLPFYRWLATTPGIEKIGFETVTADWEKHNGQYRSGGGAIRMYAVEKMIEAVVSRARAKAKIGATSEQKIRHDFTTLLTTYEFRCCQFDDGGNCEHREYRKLLDQMKAGAPQSYAGYCSKLGVEYNDGLVDDCETEPWARHTHAHIDDWEESIRDEEEGCEGCGCCCE